MTDATPDIGAPVALESASAPAAASASVAQKTVPPPPPSQTDEVKTPSPSQTKTPPTVENKEVEITLHPAFLSFVLSKRYHDSHEAVKSLYGLTNEQAMLVSDLDRLVMSKRVDLESYLLVLDDEFAALPEEKRKTMYGQLLADRFVPLGDAMKPSALAVARSRSLVLPALSYYRVYTQPLTYSGAASEVATAAGLSLLDQRLRERMREVVMNKATKKQLDPQLRETLVRSIDFDGLGLDATTADRVLTTIGDILGRAAVISEDAYSARLAAQTAEATAKRMGPTPEDEDAAEIASIQAAMPAPPRSTTELDKALDATLGRLTEKPTDEYLAKRLRNIISSRFRDVRSASDFRMLLARDAKVGGMGLEREAANTLAAEVEASYTEFHEAISGEEKKKIDTQLEEQKRKIEERKQREAAEHAKWYEERIRSKKEGEVVKQKAFEELRNVKVTASGPTTPIDLKEHLIETTKYGPLVSAPTTHPTAPVPVMSAPTMPSAAPIAKPGVKVSPPTVVMASIAAKERPTLDAMRYAGPRLVGLMGELKNISIAEFRRLAKQPRDAANKIRQNLEILEHESFERGTEGIRAFRSSPLQEAYVHLVQESFSAGKPVADLAKAKRDAGEDVLTPEEIAAIVELNSALHY